MHRVVPELIIENYRAGRYSGEFPAVGLFLDLSGFSTMTDTLMQHGQHGAEALAGLMHGVFDPLVESIFNYGGKIVGFAGDGIMALYPIESDTKSIALASDNLPAAVQHAENILVHLANGGTLEGAEEPLRIYYACYLALEKNRDPRSSDLLAKAVGLLDSQVSNFAIAPILRCYFMRLALIQREELLVGRQSLQSHFVCDICVLATRFFPHAKCVEPGDRAALVGRGLGDVFAVSFIFVIYVNFEL